MKPQLSSNFNIHYLQPQSKLEADFRSLLFAKLDSPVPGQLLIDLN